MPHNEEEMHLSDDRKLIVENYLDKPSFKRLNTIIQQYILL
jgi:hypothetical protein